MIPSRLQSALFGITAGFLGRSFNGLQTSTATGRTLVNGQQKSGDSLKKTDRTTATTGPARYLFLTPLSCQVSIHDCYLSREKWPDQAAAAMIRPEKRTAYRIRQRPCQAILPFWSEPPRQYAPLSRHHPCVPPWRHCQS